MNGTLPDYVSSETAVLILGVTSIGALVCYLKTNLSPGGLIVPGVLVLTALEGPVSLIRTVVCTAACYGVARCLAAKTILYGKRLFVVCLVLSVIMEVSLFMSLHSAAPKFFPGDSLGFLVPGLVSYQCFRQGVVPTAATAGIVTAVGCLVALTALAF
jgi:poly-gamma-glutamate biosynthesis protein PgsC/CapC